jgi:hypothetical protein
VGLLFKPNIKNRIKGGCDSGLQRFFTFFALLQNWTILGNFFPVFCKFVKPRLLKKTFLEEFSFSVFWQLFVNINKYIAFFKQSELKHPCLPADV